MARRIKKDDLVFINTGKNKGKVGKVKEVLTAENKVIIEGINVVKLATKDPNKTTSKELPIHISNVSYWDQELKQPTKIGFKFIPDPDKADKVRKVRFAKKTNTEIK